MKLEYFKDTIGIFPDALPLDICDDIINSFEEYNKKGITESGRTLGGKNYKMKNSMDLDLMGHDDQHLDDLAAELAWRSNDMQNEHMLKFPQDPLSDGTGNSEGFSHLHIWGEEGTHYPIWNVQKYDKGVGHYEGWHTEENYNRNTCHRLMVASYYLNDVEEGGELVFPLSDIKFKPKAGTFACFPCGWPWVHYAKKPISNDKYIVTTWLQANWINSIEFKDPAPVEKSGPTSKGFNWNM